MERIQTPGKRVKGSGLYASHTLVFGPASYVPSGSSFMDCINSYNDGKGSPDHGTTQRLLDDSARKSAIEDMEKLAEKYGYKVEKI